MRVAILAAGAGGMYCGSCMRDNRLAATLRAQGRDVVLVPLYTPLRTDEEDVSVQRVYYGGINVFLQQKSALFRHTPGWLDRVFDAPRLLRGVGRWAARTRPEALGDLTLSVMRGERGAQRKELEKLIAGLRAIEPSLVALPNLMFVGVARRLKAALGVPVLCALSGEDIFLDALPEPHQTDAMNLICERASDIDGFIAPTEYYGRNAAERFRLPAERVHRVPLGVRVDDVPSRGEPPAEPFTIGYLARICPEKGLRGLAKALVLLRQSGRNCRLRVAGYLGAADRDYFDEVCKYVREHDAEAAFTYVGEVDRAGKLDFLRTLHAFSVPSVYREAKGLYVLEALAAGVPVVQPRHGSFPDIVETTGGGLLFKPGDSRALADALARLMDDVELRAQLGERGRAAVHASFTDHVMAEQTWGVYERYHAGDAAS